MVVVGARGLGVFSRSMEAFGREQPTPPLDANRLLISQRTPQLTAEML